MVRAPMGARSVEGAGWISVVCTLCHGLKLHGHLEKKEARYKKVIYHHSINSSSIEKNTTRQRTALNEK